MELSWRESTEADLAGYRVRRQTGDSTPTLLNENLTATPSFSDSSVQTGKTYRYTVAAVDRNNNESAPSESIEAVIP